MEVGFPQDVESVLKLASSLVSQSGRGLFKSAFLAGSFAKQDPSRPPDRRGAGTSDVDVRFVPNDDPELLARLYPDSPTSLRKFAARDERATLVAEWEARLRETTARHIDIDVGFPLEGSKVLDFWSQSEGPLLPALVTAPSANEAYRDAALRHQIDLRRYSSGLTKRVAQLLEQADMDLTEKLRLRLARFEGRPLDFTGERWKAMLADIREARAVALNQYKELVRSELRTLSTMEGAREVSLLQASIPIEITFAAVAADQLRAIITSSPFQGRFLRDWFSTLEAGDQQRLTTALQLGMVNGEPAEDIVRRVVGTRKNQYTDGILSITRRDAQAIVRTAVNHVSNTARSYVWDANSDIITARIWVSTLDGRTSAICRARDGHGTAVGDNPLPEGVQPLKPAGAKPPAHFGCRSVMVAYIDGVGLLGNRPTVTDTRTRVKREIDFRRMAKEQGKPIQDIRKAWAAENVGRVPAATTYQDFLKRQPAGFQDEVLGKTKAKLFREGGLNVDQFVDRAGNELTLSQLAERKPDAFRKAGLDPEKF